MINLDSKHLLFIEPKLPKSESPINDYAVTRMLVMLDFAQPVAPYYKGFHACVCGEISTNYNIELLDGIITNSLAVHYLQWHRDEIPPSELDKLDSIEFWTVVDS